MAKTKDFNDLMLMAKAWKVDGNPLFVQMAEQHAELRQTIKAVHKQLTKKDALTVTKEYVKGRENSCANPLLKELPRLTAEANSTARTMLSIIQELGTPPAPKGKLSGFLQSDD